MNLCRNTEVSSNLIYETRLGLSKHRSTYDHPKTGNFDELNCSLEGQTADISDRIAYNCHDLEDGMRAGLIKTEQLKDITIFSEAQERIKAESIDDWTIRRTRTAKVIIDKLVGNCIKESRNAIDSAGIKILDDIYTRGDNLVLLSEDYDAELAELEQFLLSNLYEHELIMQTVEKIRGYLGSLFEKFCRKSDLMPGYFRSFIPEHGLERTVCDYIAGMTDRFCIKQAEQ
ncbi:MAG: hypothetical protein ACYTBP_05565 [Planctomycetota bacterium]